MTKRVAILQSNYLPWKGYFDLIGLVDEFVLYDDAQFTKNDWRNRNLIKTPKGVEWISVPVGQDISRRIRDVTIADSRWQEKHWKTLVSNYRRSKCFTQVAAILEPLFLNIKFESLSELNRVFIVEICRYLGIQTRISASWDYEVSGGKVERLVSLCCQTNATIYVSGPSARSYMEPELFSSRGIEIEWFSYEGYPEYPQQWGGFEHAVSIVDLLFNCGEESRRYMKIGAKAGH